MLLLKIDPTPSHSTDKCANVASPATNLLELIQIRRDRELGTHQVARGVAHALPSPHPGMNPGMTMIESGEYRDDDLISVLTLGDEFLVFVTDDGPSPYLFRIMVEADRIAGVLAGGQVGSGELSVARFAANGVMTWIPLPRAIRSTIHETAAQLGATILGPVERTEVSDGAKALQLVLRAGRQISNRVNGLLSLDLSPPSIGEHRHWEGRQYSWGVSNQAHADLLSVLAVNDNQTSAPGHSEARP